MKISQYLKMNNKLYKLINLFIVEKKLSFLYRILTIGLFFIMKSMGIIAFTWNYH